MTLHRKTPIKRSKRANLKPRKPIPAKNGKRRAKAFARAYHSRERVAFVKQLPCIVTGLGPSENAHGRGGGVGRKADYQTIVPLIRAKHAELHQVGAATFQARYGLSLAVYAEQTEQAWQAHCGC